MDYRVHAFGGLSIERDGQPVAALTSQRKALALLALLAAHGTRGASRDRIVALLWPDAGADAARNSLSQLLHRLRRALGPDAIAGNGELRLNAEIVGSDVGDFRRAIETKQHQAAAELYRGDFLDGFFLRDSAEFERWVDAERRALRQACEVALDRLAAQAEAAGDHATLIRALQHRVGLDPLSSDIALRYMNALAAAGRRESAIRHAGVHAELVRVELDAGADPRVMARAEALRAIATPSSGAALRQPPAADPRAPSIPVPAAAPAKAHPSHLRWTLWAFAGGLAALLLVVIAFAKIERDANAADPSRVLVTALVNRTRDTSLNVLGPMAADWITQALSESEVVDVVDAPTAFDVSRVAASDSAASDSERLRNASKLTRAGTVVGGAYYLVGDSIVFDATITDARTGAVLRALPPVSASRSAPTPALEQLRERAAGALATILDPRLASVSARSTHPPLIEAYREYLRGLELFTQNHPKDAFPVFLEAAHRDSTFMLPVIWAIYERGMAGVVPSDPLRDSLIDVLESHRATLAPLDRGVLDFYQLHRRGAPKEELLGKLREITRLAPASNWSYAEAGYLMSTGRGEEALAALRRIDPEHGWARSWSSYWGLLTEIQHNLGDYRGELESVQRGRKFDPGLDGFFEARALIGLGNKDSALAIASRYGTGGIATGTSASPQEKRAILLDMTARELRAHGYGASADSMERIEIGLVRDFDRTGRSDLGMIAEATLDMGQLGEAQRAALAMLRDSVDYGDAFDKAEIHAVLGQVAAIRRDLRGANREIDAIEGVKSTVPLREQRAMLATGQAAIAGALHDRERALRYLAEQEAYSRGQPAGVVAHSARTLAWLEHDPVLRRPYIYGRPYEPASADR